MNQSHLSSPFNYINNSSNNNNKNNNNSLANSFGGGGDGAGGGPYHNENNFISNLNNSVTQPPQLLVNNNNNVNGGFLSSLGKSFGNSSGWESSNSPNNNNLLNQQQQTSNNLMNQQPLLIMNNQMDSNTLQQLLIQQQLLNGLNPSSNISTTTGISNNGNLSSLLLGQQQQQQYFNLVNRGAGLVTSNNSSLTGIGGISSSSSSISSGSTSPPDQTTTTTNNATTTTTNAEENSEFFPIACEPCRRQHRKCDKKLPCCSVCQQRSVECIYRESKRNAIKGTEEKKRKKKKGLTTFKPKDGVISTTTSTTADPKFKPYHSHEVVTTERNSDSENENVEEVGHLSKRNVIDFYFDIACDGCPLVTREELENYIVVNNDNEEEKSNKKEMFPLFLSVRALCECRYGLSELAEKTAQRAKKALSKMFDQIQSFHIAATYGNLATYEGWVGRYENAKFYMQILQYYVKTQLSGELKRNNLTDCERNLENLVFYFNNVLGDDLNRLDLKEFLKRLPSIYSFFAMDKFPDEWIDVINRDINSENCFEIWTVVHMAVDTIKRVAKGLMDTSNKSQALCCFSYGPEYEELVNPIFTMIQNSLRISILSKSHNPTVRDIMEKAALEITEITEHAWFPLFPIETLACVSKATFVHLQIIKTLISNASTDFKYNGIDYYEILEKDMRAFNLMKKRYKFVGIFFKELLEDMEQYLALIRVRRVVNTNPLTMSQQQGGHDVSQQGLDQLLEITQTQPEEHGIAGLENPLFWDSSSFLSEQDLSSIFTRELE